MNTVAAPFLRATKKKPVESTVVRVQGHEFTANYESFTSDPDAGLASGYIELGSIYIDNCPDDIGDLLAPHIREEIAEQINTRIRAEGSRL